MRIEESVQIVKDFFAAMGGYNKHDLLALAAEDIEWIIPGEDWSRRTDPLDEYSSICSPSRRLDRKHRA